MASNPKQHGQVLVANYEIKYIDNYKPYIKCLIQYFDLRILRFHLSIFLLSLCVAWDNFPATSGIESFQVQRRAPQDGDGWM